MASQECSIWRVRGKIASPAIASVKVIADYAVSMNDRLFELDVNPLIVMPDGAVALDAFRRSES